MRAKVPLFTFIGGLSLFCELLIFPCCLRFCGRKLERYQVLELLSDFPHGQLGIEMQTVQMCRHCPQATPRCIWIAQLALYGVRPSSVCENKASREGLLN